MSLEQRIETELETLEHSKDFVEKQAAKRRVKMFLTGLETGESPDTAILRMELDEKRRQLAKLAEEEESVQKNERFKNLMNTISTLRRDLSNMEQYARHMERQTADDKERVGAAWQAEGKRQQKFYEEDRKRFVDFVISQTLQDVEGGPPPPSLPPAKRTLLEKVMRRQKTREEALRDLERSIQEEQRG